MILKLWEKNLDVVVNDSSEGLRSTQLAVNYGMYTQNSSLTFSG